MYNLSKKLKEMYLTADKGNRVAAIHVFGIKYSEQLIGKNATEIAIAAGISKSYGTEISKGVKLSKFATLNDKTP